MKFSQMPYERPAYEEMSTGLQNLLTRFKEAKTADECFGIYKEYDDFVVNLEH